jgi:hypothetical protein
MARLAHRPHVPARIVIHNDGHVQLVVEVALDSLDTTGTPSRHDIDDVHSTPWAQSDRVADPQLTIALEMLWMGVV